MVKRNKYAQSAPVSGFNSPSSSGYTSREQSPVPQKQKQQHRFSPWLIGGGITLPFVYGGTRWLLNRPSVQAMIARTFNKGNRIVDSATVQPTTSASEDSNVLPSHTPLPISTPVGAEDL